MSYKRSRRRQKKLKNPLLLVLTFILVLGVSIGTTTAFLVDKTDPVVNEFNPGEVEITVTENFDSNTKSNVCVNNPEDVDVYVRVALLPVWEDGNENVVAEPASLENDLTINFGSSNPGWEEGSDGFWYYTGILKAKATTGNLIESAVVKADSAGYQKGYQMNLQVMAQAIQAEPKDAVESAWGVTVNDDGTLTVN